MKGQKRRNLVRFMVLTNKQCRSSGKRVHERRRKYGEVEPGIEGMIQLAKE